MKRINGSPPNFASTPTGLSPYADPARFTSQLRAKNIPDKGAQMVRYYGWYSNKLRGVRQRDLPPELLVRRPGVSPPPPAKLPSKRWRDLTCPAVA